LTLLKERKACGGFFDFETKQERLVEVTRELENVAVWDNPERAQELGRERVQLSDVVELLNSLTTGLKDALDLWDLSVTENDLATFTALQAEVSTLKTQVEKLEFQRMFSGEMDPNNAYLEIQSGAGGTEAQDWAEMLMRMYLRWGNQNHFETEILDQMAGDVAGIKGVTIKFSGDYAYGWLRTETGVHRLVRKSPFDSGNKRHTSFASVFISPELSDDIQIEINPADLRIDTYRSSGAGGQHVNKTDSAIRITHIPTNTVVASQNQRSQHQNRAEAMKRLQAKLYEMELLARDSTKQAIEASKTDIAWGHQIRSYVLDQSRIKDLRTGLENSNTQAVLDGDLNAFMEASLKAGL
jgi:peptide chain release factor 2